MTYFSGSRDTTTYYKAAVRAATTANITLSGEQTIDGISLVSGDRCLVKDQSTGSQNGIYVVSTGSWTRATDANQDSEVVGGILVYALQGSVGGGKLWSLTTTGTIIIGTTALTFASVSGGVTDHGALTGLADDDHTQYLLADGTRSLSAPIILPEVATPATPSSGFGKIYFKSDGKAYALNDAGVETDLQASGSGGGNIGDTVTSGTVGSILFVDTGPVLAQDNANLFWDNANNRLGVGTNTPSVPLDMTAAPVIDGDNRVILQTLDSTAMAAGVGAGFTFGGKYTSGGSYAGWAGIKGIKSDGVSGNLGGELVLMTRPTSGPSITERMRITKDGDVGIGTATPSSKFDISNSHTSDTAAFARYNNTNVSGQIPVHFVVNGTTRGVIRSDYGGNLTFASNGGGHYFFTGGDFGAGGTERLQIKGAGEAVFNENGADYDFRIEGDTEPNLLFVDASTDRIGIGTTTPAVLMQLIKNQNSGTQLDVSNTNTGAAATSAISVGDGTDGTAMVEYRAAANFGGLGVSKAAHWYSTSGNVNTVFSTDNASGKIRFHIGAPVASSNELFSMTASNIVFNENGNNVDFRVEGDTETNLLFVDASTDRVGIGTASPAAQLHASGKSPSSTESGQVFGDNVAYATGTGRTRIVVGNTAANSEIILGQDSTHGLLFNWTYNATAASAYGALETYAGNNPLVLQSAGGNVGIGTVPNSVVLLHVYKNQNDATRISLENPSTGTTAQAQYSLASSGADVEFAVFGSGWNTTPQDVRQANRANFLLTAGNDLYFSTINTSQSIVFNISNALDGSAGEAFRINNAGVVFNEQGVNKDFRVEGDTNANLFCVDASADKVGIGTATPTGGRLHLSGSGNEEYITVESTSSGGSTVDLYSSGTSGFKGPSAGVNTASLPFLINTASTERLRAGTSELVINDPANNYDFRVEGQTDPNLLFADASTNRIGIGTNTPSYKFQIQSGSAGIGFDPTTQSMGGTFGSGGNFTWHAEAPGSATGVSVLMGGSTRGDDQKNAVIFRVGSTEYFRIDGDAAGHTTGYVGIGTTTPTSKLHVTGSVSTPITTKTSSYTATASDYTILCDATSAAITITLPAVSGISGRVYIIKKIDSSANAITVDGNASETIDGATTQILSAIYESITIQSNGTAWFIV